MAHEGMTMKNARIERATNGYLLYYDKYIAGGEYDGMRFVGDCKMIFTDGHKAIKALDEVVESEQYMPSMSAPKEEEKEE